MERILGIDLGVDNFATCVTSFGNRPFIIDGKILKSISYMWKREDDRLLALARKQRLDVHTKKRKRLTRKKDQRINYYLNVTTNYIIKYCQDNLVDKIVVGTTKDVNSSTVFNNIDQKFFRYVNHITFLRRLKKKCDLYQIEYVEQEESYTSKSSFIDSDILPMMPTDYNWNDNFTGKRVHRGLYKSKNGILINADVNGAYNIIRKYTQDFNIERLNSGGLEPPIRIRF